MKKLLLLLALASPSCTSFPPMTLGYTFPMTVFISTPGWTAPAVPVAPSVAVNSPVLMIPAGVKGNGSSAIVGATEATPEIKVPVVTAPVSEPVLAVPVQK